MGRLIELHKVAFNLSVLATQIEILNSGGNYYDINRHTENIFIPILNLIFNISLVNVNTIRPNYPAIDLSDENKKVSIQVTSSDTTRRVQSTLQKIDNQQIKGDIYILIIKPKSRIRQKKYNTQHATVYIIDFSFLNCKISALEIDKIICISELLEKEIGFKSDNYFKYGIALNELNEPKVEIISEFKYQYEYLYKTLESKKYKTNDLIHEILQDIKFQRNDIAENYFILAQIFEMLYDYDKAIEYYKNACKNAPKKLEYLTELINLSYIIDQRTELSKLIDNHSKLIDESGLSRGEIIQELERRSQYFKTQNNKYKELICQMNLSSLNFFWANNIEMSKKCLKNAYFLAREVLTDNHMRTKSIKEKYDVYFFDFE